MNDPSEGTKKLSPGRLIRVTGSLVAVGLLAWLLTRQDWREIGQNVAEIGLPRFLLAVGLLMLSRLAISFRWYALLRGAGQQVTYFSSLRLTFAGLFGNNFLPSTIGGDGIRLAGAIQAGWNGAVAAASLVMDRLVGIIGMAAFLPFTLPRVAAHYQAGNLVLGPVLCMAAAAPGNEQNPVKKLWRKGWRVTQRIWETIVLWVRRPQTLVLPLVFSFAHMVSMFGTLWVILKGLNDPLTFWEVGGLWGMVYFITLLPISIGGIGLQEWAVLFTFHQLGGVSEAHSLTLALLFRTLMMFASLPGAVFVPGILKKRKKSG
ncbi:MAG: flippase-like domain-containing protein [Anaerolineales bacterium]|nr:flippase-like domain-containing protein [Anaerolineales bacterium]